MAKNKRTTEIEVDVGHVPVEVSLDDFNTEDLEAELRERNSGIDASDVDILRQIVWQHDVLGIPLQEVVGNLMHEHGVQRNSATAALSLDK